MIKKFGLQHCKKCYLFLIIFGFVILITAINDKRYEIPHGFLPWEVTTEQPGLTKVFGLVLDQTSMRDAFKVLNVYPDTALFAHADGRMTLEAYISSVSLSGLTAKMILEYGVDSATLKRYIEGSVEKEGTPSGAFKYKLNETDLLQALEAPVVSISYIPYAQFDDDIIMQRFGLAAETVEINKNTSILLYPDLGLSITYNKKSKEILQYVAPKDFSRLKQLAYDAREAALKENKTAK